MPWIWAIVIAVIVLLVLIIVLTALLHWIKQRRRAQESQREEAMGNKNDCPQTEHISLKLPLPNPDGAPEEEVSMEPTQHSPMKYGQEDADKSSKRDSWETEKSSHSERDNESGSLMTKKGSHSPLLNILPSKEEMLSTLDSSCAQHSTEDEHILKAPPIMITSTGTSLGTTAPVSAGFTPRIARSLPVRTKAPSLNIGGPSPMNTPTRNVQTAKEIMEFVVVRSENAGSICDEDAGRTPVAESPPVSAVDSRVKMITVSTDKGGTVNFSCVPTSTPSQSNTAKSIA